MENAARDALIMPAKPTIHDDPDTRPISKYPVRVMLDDFRVCCRRFLHDISDDQRDRILPLAEEIARMPGTRGQEQLTILKDSFAKLITKGPGEVTSLTTFESAANTIYRGGYDRLESSVQSPSLPATQVLQVRPVLVQSLAAELGKSVT
jgi:hypothetical protein